MKIDADDVEGKNTNASKSGAISGRTPPSCFPL